MSDTLKLPFQLERPSASTPATTAKDVDIDTINGVNATTVQKALEVLAAREGGEGNDTEYEYVSLGSNNGGEEVTFTLTEDTAIYISCSADNPNGQWSLKNSQNETIKSNVALTAGEKYYCGILSAGTYTADHNPTDTLTVYKKVKKQPTASEVTINPITGVNATNVQRALELLKASIVNGGEGSGSGLEHASIDSSYSVVVLDPTKTFASQITAENTVYIIQDEFDLNGQVVWMKNNTTLWFYGGMLKNGCIKNIKIGKTTEIYQTKVIAEYHKVCFQNVVVHGWYHGTAYDWMFEDTVRTEDDYLVFYNLCMFEKAHIVEKSVINLTTWLNPYYDAGYDLNQDATGKNKSTDKAVNCWCGVNLDGHGCTLNVLMDDQEKLDQCGSVSRANSTYDEDGNEILGRVWGLSLSTPLVRCRHRLTNRDDVFNGFELRNIKIFDDNTINAKGSNPNQYDLTIIDPKYNVEVTSKFHSNFFIGGDHHTVILENVIYKGRLQFGSFGGNSDWGDVPLPNMYVTHCDIECFNYFIFENFSAARYRSFDAIYYTDCRFKGTASVGSNSTTKTKEVWSNCVIDQCTQLNEDDSISYYISNCIFKGGAWCVYGNDGIVHKEIDNCTFECYNISEQRASESGYNRRIINALGSVAFRNCNFLTDYNSDEARRTMFKIGWYESSSIEDRENSTLSFINCKFQMPDANCFTGDFYNGKVLIQDCLIQSISKAKTTFFTAKEMKVSVNSATELESLLRNPRVINTTNKNVTYGKYACGWNYLSASSDMTVVNDEVVSCDNQSIILCNADDIKFYSNIFSMSFLIDFPTASCVMYGSTEQNFKFSFTLGNYNIVINNPLGSNAISVNITDATTSVLVANFSVLIVEGLHNYTFSFDGTNIPFYFIDDMRMDFQNTNIKSYADISYGGANIASSKLTVGQACGLKQIIIKPFAII